MNRIVFSTLCLTFLASFTFAADNYKVGDELYVWAKSGLNVRTGAGTNFEVLMKVDFGDKITVLEKTDKTYKLAAITKVESSKINDTKPLYFDGNWVKVKMGNGEEGYVIDQYFLKLRPFQTKNIKSSLNLKVLLNDTIYANSDLGDGEVLRHVMNRIYENGIMCYAESGGVWSTEIFYLPNFSLEEVMILFHDAWDNNYSEPNLSKINTNEIIFTAHQQCSYRLRQMRNFVKIEIDCSC